MKSKNRHRAEPLKKTIMYDGKSVLVEGDHMKDENSFIESTAPLFGNEDKAREAWKFIQSELAPKATKVKVVKKDVN